MKQKQADMLTDIINGLRIDLTRKDRELAELRAGYEAKLFEMRSHLDRIINVLRSDI